MEKVTQFENQILSKFISIDVIDSFRDNLLFFYEKKKFVANHLIFVISSCANGVDDVRE